MLNLLIKDQLTKIEAKVELQNISKQYILHGAI